jgi:hypothetical protein
MDRKKSFEWVSLAVTVALAAMLRLHGLGHQSFWNDETATRLTAVDPNLHFFQVEAPGEYTPSPYFFIIKTWMKVFGPSETSVRTPSALCGIAAVIVMYFFGRRLARDSSAGFLVGLFAALLLAMSRFHIAYSQEARAYSVAILLGLISCYTLAVLLTSHRQWPQWLYVVSTSAMFWNHPSTLFLFVTQGVFIGFCYVTGFLSPTGIPLRRWLTLMGAIVITLAPWIDMAGYLAHGGQAWMPKPRWHEIAESYLGDTTACILFAILAIGSLIYAWKGKDAGPMLGWLLALLPVAVPVLMSRGRISYFVPRYGMVAIIGCYLLAGFGAALLGRILGSVTVLVLCVALSPPLIADFRAGINSQVKPDVRGAAEQIEKMAEPDDAVWCPFDLLNYPLTDYLSNSNLKIWSTLPPQGLAEAGHVHRIWLVLERTSDSKPQARAAAIQVIGTAPFEVKTMWFHQGIMLGELRPKNPPATAPHNASSSARLAKPTPSGTVCVRFGETSP